MGTDDSKESSCEEATDLSYYFEEYERHGSMTFNGTSSHGFLGRGKMPPVKYPVEEAGPYPTSTIFVLSKSKHANVM